MKYSDHQLAQTLPIELHPLWVTKEIEGCTNATTSYADTRVGYGF